MNEWMTKVFVEQPRLLRVSVKYQKKMYRNSTMNKRERTGNPKKEHNDNVVNFKYIFARLCLKIKRKLYSWPTDLCQPNFYFTLLDMIYFIFVKFPAGYSLVDFSFVVRNVVTFSVQTTSIFLL